MAEARWTGGYDLWKRTWRSPTLYVEAESGATYEFEASGFVVERDPVADVRFVQQQYTEGHTTTIVITYEDGAWRYQLTRKQRLDENELLPKIFEKWSKLPQPSHITLLSGTVPDDFIRELAGDLSSRSRLYTDGRYVYYQRKKVAQFPEGGMVTTSDNATFTLVPVYAHPIQYLLIVEVSYQWNYVDEQHKLQTKLIVPIPLKDEEQGDDQNG